MESYLGKRKLGGNGAPGAEREPSSVAPAAGSFQAVALGYDVAGEEAAAAEARRVVGEMDFFKTEKRKEEAAGRSRSAAAGAPGDLSINKDDLTINVRR
jgi:hypothetical protein